MTLFHVPTHNQQKENNKSKNVYASIQGLFSMSSVFLLHIHKVCAPQKMTATQALTNKYTAASRSRSQFDDIFTAPFMKSKKKYA
jgi:hypothetical protein